ncbi:hypothetical protein GTW40_19390 [Streptomyces sp. SID4985]|uniref:hypothetical protein n=1 Tax=Streptomyces sp. SID4985 TaxID=2690292 RepID=UPI00136B5DFB|nr:hypothetical protein [Streptomyces sp. SID4985]MYQ47195.1 hypothetical protein [Streptomyces sp. SID4985]
MTAMWSCAGPVKFSIVSAGKTLAASGCGDGGGVLTAQIPHAHLRETAWKFTALNSVIWRISVTLPGGK